MLLEVINFLPDDLLDRLVEFSKRSDIPWQLQEMQENLPRKKISWMPDSPMEEAHNWFKDLPLFSHFNFLGLSLWKDDLSFYMKDHCDNDTVKIAVQIYLDDRNSPGTTFGDRTIKYGRNRGYIMFNNPSMIHGVMNQTPHEGRLSLYALYSDDRL